MASLSQELLAERASERGKQSYPRR
jgi:hypothetical protein